MTGAITSPESVPLQQSTQVSVDWLRMDRENPRLVDLTTDASDESVIAQLFRREELGELLQSIAANGYMDIEPMIVILSDDNKSLTVLEGNRRLAALRLFREPELVNRVKEKENIRIPLPDIQPPDTASLNQVSVYRMPDRASARSFIGFKHINGAAKWESYAKAKFAANWFRDPDTDLETIAEKIGDKHDTIKRMVSAIYVLEQAKENGFFSLDDQVSGRFNFSHLYTALSRTDYMRFLGLGDTWTRHEPQPNPVPEDHLPHLRELMLWLYGSKEANQEPVVQSQNPDVKRLGEVLSSKEALLVLRSHASLNDAHASTEKAEGKLSAALLQARASVREAANNLRGFDGHDDSLLNIAEDLHETATTVYERMKKKRNTAVEDED